MPYAQSAVTRGTARRTQSGRYRQTVSFTETEAAAASEWSIGGLPSEVDMVAYKATLTAGAGTTIGPAELGNAAAFTLNTQAHIGTSTLAADAHVNDQTKLACSLGSGGTLYGRSKVDAGSDNSISVEIVIEYGSA